MTYNAHVNRYVEWI